LTNENDSIEMSKQRGRNCSIVDIGWVSRRKSTDIHAPKRKRETKMRAMLP